MEFCFAAYLGVPAWNNDALIRALIFYVALLCIVSWEQSLATVVIALYLLCHLIGILIYVPLSFLKHAIPEVRLIWFIWMIVWVNFGIASGQWAIPVLACFTGVILPGSYEIATYTRR